ncbi:long-chain acyl-CoA synthetase [Tribonema minus]|uniref:Long-chain acyl-CoA synthetase n=1 Tax=Tribonema minus TaxID=303371 RepID=A0A836C922_9STRA|nr:long-chain acyl-CoA synthetase [Tribonema minus]
MLLLISCAPSALRQLLRKSAPLSRVVGAVRARLHVVLVRLAQGTRMNAASAPVKKDRLPASQVANRALPVGGRGYRKLTATEKDIKVVPDLWTFMEKQCPSQIAIVDALHGGITVVYTYAELRERIVRLAGAFQALGLAPGQCVSVFSENSNRWLTAEQGIMLAGGCNAVRGVAAPVEELQYIYENSLSVGVVVEKAELLKKLVFSGKGLNGDQGPPRFAMVLYAAGKSGAQIREELGLPVDMQVMTFQEAITARKPLAPVRITADQPATLVYTSGTTSKPKGVILRHSNMVHQILENSFNRANGGKYDPWVGDTFVSILPCWHIFERTAEYFMLARGVEMVYSNIRNFKNDLVKYRPHFLVAVPRLYETIYKGAQTNFASQPKSKQKLVAIFTAISTLQMKLRSVVTGMVVGDKPPSPLRQLMAAVALALVSPFHKVADKLVWSKVRAGMGGRIKCLVSGGSSLAGYLEDFFDMIGHRVVVGYGLTETSPVILNRLVEHNLKGSVGLPPGGTTIKLVNPETREPVPAGEIGVVCAKGPQIMAGYNRNEEATRQVMDSEGFFDTGDLGRINPATGDLILTGRAKDTIVLSNGENVEPEPLENAVVGKSDFVDQVMLVGQDERFLGGIVVVNPAGLAAGGLLPASEARRLSGLLGPTPLTTGVKGTPQDMDDAQQLVANPQIKAAVLADLKRIGKGGRPWEQIQDIVVRLEPFTISNGLMTQTLKVKRNVVTDRFAAEIKAMYKQ